MIQKWNGGVYPRRTGNALLRAKMNPVSFFPSFCEEQPNRRRIITDLTAYALRCLLGKGGPEIFWK
jgi:hypothetical protein